MEQLSIDPILRILGPEGGSVELPLVILNSKAQAEICAHSRVERQTRNPGEGF